MSLICGKNPHITSEPDLTYMGHLIVGYNLIDKLTVALEIKKKLCNLQPFTLMLEGQIVGCES